MTEAIAAPKWRTERQLNTWLRGRLTGDWTRVENMVMRGTPDVQATLSHADVNGGLPFDVWIELKIIGAPFARWRSLGTRHGVRPCQAAWIKRRSEAGGRCCVLVGFGCGTVLVIPGRNAHLLQSGEATPDFLHARHVPPHGSVRALTQAIYTASRPHDYDAFD